MTKLLIEELNRATTKLNEREQEVFTQVVLENLQTLLIEVQNRVRSTTRKSSNFSTPSQVELILQDIKEQEMEPEGCAERLMENVKEFRENFTFKHDEQA